MKTCGDTDWRISIGRMTIGNELGGASGMRSAMRRAEKAAPGRRTDPAVRRAAAPRGWAGPGSTGMATWRSVAGDLRAAAKMGSCTDRPRSLPGTRRSDVSGAVFQSPWTTRGEVSPGVRRHASTAARRQSRRTDLVVAAQLVALVPNEGAEAQVLRPNLNDQTRASGCC